MKRSIQTLSLVGSFFVAMSTNLLVDEVVSEKKAETSEAVVHDGTNLAEGQTLPQNIVRARIQTRANAGKAKAYDEDGKSVDANFERSLLGSALYLGYGITNEVTAEVVAPFVWKHEIEFNGIKKDTHKNKTGFGDMALGAMYNFLRNDRVLVSAGLGLRLPTGQYADVNLGEGTGLGFYDLGLRLNADVQLVKGLWLSLQDQEEVGLASIKNKVADTNYDKKNISRKAFAQLAYGFGALSSDLRALSVKGRYAYDYDSALVDRTTKKIVSEATTLHKVGGGLTVDATSYGIPVSFETLYMTPVAGRHQKDVSSTVEMTLNTYVQI